MSNILLRGRIFFTIFWTQTSNLKYYCSNHRQNALIYIHTLTKLLQKPPENHIIPKMYTFPDRKKPSENKLVLLRLIIMAYTFYCKRWKSKKLYFSWKWLRRRKRNIELKSAMSVEKYGCRLNLKSAFLICSLKIRFRLKKYFIYVRI